MRVKKTAINRVVIESNTSRGKHLIDDALARAERLKTDAERAERLKEAVCSACWYLMSPRIGGAAMTARECSVCGTDNMFPSTATDALCKSCATENNLCCWCCGDIDMKSRRSPRPYEIDNRTT